MGSEFPSTPGIAVRPLTPADIPAARQIFQLAFGTARGLPNPAQYLADRDYIGTRLRARPAVALAAEIDGRLSGTAIGVNWGSLGVFGPLTIHPDYWNRGVAHALLEPCLARQKELGARYQGLLTTADSPKHLWLYQKFAFWPRFLTAVMSKPPALHNARFTHSKFSDFDEAGRDAALANCSELTQHILDGLDLSGEIMAAYEQNLGDTVLLDGDMGVDGFAVCHCGEATEAGSGACYVKFGAARSGTTFGRLLAACEHLACSRGLAKVIAGVNTARREAYRQMLDLGFKTMFQGVAMHRGDDPAYNRPGVFVIDDWR